MFDAPPRRHPLQTFPFWFLIVLCAGGIAAWKFGMFSGAESTPVSSEFNDWDPLPAAFEDTRPSSNVGAERVADEPSAAPLQAEAHENQRTPERRSGESQPPPWILSAAASREDGMTVRTVSARTDAESTGVVTADARISSTEESPPGKVPAVSVPLDLKQADRLIEQGDDVAAHRLLSTWYWEHPGARPEFQDRLDLLARRIYFSPQPHYIEPHVVQFGDRLETIAKEYRLPWEYLARLNRVDPQRIQAHQKLKVLQGPFSVVADLSRYELTVHAHGYYVTRFSIGVGKDRSSPVGTFKVTDKVQDPTYYGPDGVIAHDDPQNPLGERWLAINDDAGTLQGYGIHGTIEPDSIGKAESRGCLRLRDRDIEVLYDLLSIGSEVIIRR